MKRTDNYGYAFMLLPKYYAVFRYKLISINSHKTGYCFLCIWLYKTPKIIYLSRKSFK